MAGYSGTPLPKKLGIGANTDLRVLGAPPALAQELQTAGPEAGMAEVVVIFSADAAEMERAYREVMRDLDPSGAIWCAWPKKSSGVATDITEDRLREMFLPTGMVDNKVAAIDDVWSGLRFVVRKELRPTWSKG